MRLGIDLDGVVADFPRRANEWLSKEMNCPPIAIDRWDWYKGYGGDVEETWERLWNEEVPNNSFFSTIYEVPGALDGLRDLRAAGHQLVFITARPAAAGPCTEQWLDARGLGGHHLILALTSKAKQFTDTDTLLDDKGETVYRHLSHGKSAVLFKRPWNREWWSRVPSVSGWPEFIQTVEAMEAMKEESDARATR